MSEANLSHLPEFLNADGVKCHKSGGIVEFDRKDFNYLLENCGGMHRLGRAIGIKPDVEIFIHSHVKSTVFLKFRCWRESQTMPGVPELDKYPRITLEQAREIVPQPQSERQESWRDRPPML